jgi:hypothetical protein
MTPCLDCGLQCEPGHDLCPACVEALLQADYDEWSAAAEAAEAAERATPPAGSA